MFSLPRGKQSKSDIVSTSKNRMQVVKLSLWHHNVMSPKKVFLKKDSKISLISLIQKNRGQGVSNNLSPDTIRKVSPVTLILSTIYIYHFEYPTEPENSRQFENCIWNIAPHIAIRKENKIFWWWHYSAWPWSAYWTGRHALSILDLTLSSVNQAGCIVLCYSGILWAETLFINFKSGNMPSISISQQQ